MDRLPPTARLLGIGFYFAACIIGGIVGGLLLDMQVFDRPLVFTWLGLALGLYLAFYGGYRMLMDVLPPTQGRSDEEDRS